MASHGRAVTVRRILISVVAVIVALALGFQAFQRLKALKEKPERREGGARPPVVRVVLLERTSFREVVRGYGVARAMREATVAAEVGGIVREVSALLEVGQRVAPPMAGEDDTPPLVRLDVQDLEDALARLGAEKEQAEADRTRLVASVAQYEEQLVVMARRLDTVRTELRRTLTLVESETLSESDADRQRLAVFALEQAEAELTLRREDTQAQVAVVDARLQVVATSANRAERDITRTRIYSPYSGVVIARHVEIGTLVAPGTPLFALVDPTLIEVAIALPASRYRQVHTADGVHEASRVSLRLGESEGVLWSGTVKRVAPRIDPDSRTFLAFVEIGDPEGEVGITPGTHVVADVEGALHENVLVVPREAFVDDVVYVAVPSGGAQDTAVTHVRRPQIRATLLGVALVDPTSDGIGLAPGERVIVTNLEDVAEGSTVRIAQPAPPPVPEGMTPTERDS